MKLIGLTKKRQSLPSAGHFRKIDCIGCIGVTGQKLSSRASLVVGAALVGAFAGQQCLQAQAQRREQLRPGVK